jgi:hypothetical protein
MKHIFFNFKEGLTPKQEFEVFGQIFQFPEIVKAGYLKPNAKKDLVRRACFIQIMENASENRIEKWLKTRTEIENGFGCAERGLL